MENKRYNNAKGGYKKEPKEFRYPVFSMRINDLTKKKLIKLRKEYGKSWNLFFCELINEYTDRRRH